MYDLILILLLNILGFQNFIGPKLYDAAEDGNTAGVDAAMTRGADENCKDKFFRDQKWQM